MVDFDIDSKLLTMTGKALNADNEEVNGVPIEFLLNDIEYDSAVTADGECNVSYICEDTEPLNIKLLSNSITKEGIIITHDCVTETHKVSNKYYSFLSIFDLPYTPNYEINCLLTEQSNIQLAEISSTDSTSWNWAYEANSGQYWEWVGYNLTTTMTYNIGVSDVFKVISKGSLVKLYKNDNLVRSTILSRHNDGKQLRVYNNNNNIRYIFIKAL